MKREIIDASNLELEDSVVNIKRVTKVVKGGRNMRFAALVVVGDKNGHVGAGLGKAAEVPEAIRKAKEDAIKKLVKVDINENGSIPYDYTGKFGSASVLLKSSPEGLVSSLVVLLVRYWSLQDTRTSVQSLSALTTSRMLFLLQSRALRQLSPQKRLQNSVVSLYTRFLTKEVI